MGGMKILMRLDGVRKRFPNGTVALSGVDLEIKRGCVHGLLGANGAGKSTLIKVLSGAFKATGGTIYWKDAAVAPSGPRAMQDMGVETIHQHIPLIPTLSVIENIYLGSKAFWRDTKASRRHFQAVCERVQYWIDPDTPVANLSIGARQMVAILQAIAGDADLIVMDEPTASLASEERELVYQIVRRLSRQENKAILFVSHFIDEIIDLTDEVTVLRDGRAVMHARTDMLDETMIAEAIVGRAIAEMETASHERDPRRLDGAPVLLELRELRSPGKLAPLSLSLRKGEVIGIAGLLGSGRSELLHVIFGADREAKGDVVLEGRTLGRSTGAAVAAGIGLVPEDRMGLGLIPGFEIWRNISLPALSGVSVGRIMPVERRERERAVDAIGKLGIKAGSPDELVTELSGGNAQKVTIAKWLYSDVKLFLFDEPTAGIDIGAKTDILILARQLASQGCGVIFVSSEFEELIAVSDRILVMRDGHCIAERAVAQTNEHDLVLLAGGQVAAADA